MEKPEQNVLKNAPEQHATLAREKWNKEQGKIRPIVPTREVQTCNPQDR
ncbi:MAG: hypothetical protein WC346_14050 [Methanogenium sp.]